jgi:nucleotidyltransferase/DNA polymerase involved in DNA repair
VQRWVLHVDLDQFIAAVEVLRRPELRGLPVVVGGDGDPTKRGVVSTASYEAREYGIGSGMPLRTAFRKCPDAVFLPVDADHYLAASHDVMETLRSFPAVVEVLGWDEAFMGVVAEVPETVARDVQRAVRERTSLWCSVGVGDNKLRAKLASALGKPAGVFRLTRENWAAVMDHRAPDALWGIGAKTARKLAGLGVGTVGELAVADPARLAAAFGPNTGPWLVRLATGEDTTPVSATPYLARSRGREETFQQDIDDPARIHDEVIRLARRVAVDVQDEGRPVRRVVVKVRFAPFFTVTHGVPLEGHSEHVGDIEKAALAALELFTLDRPVRLLGVRAELAAGQ